jgi:HPt (histidine-containing phosphotransfer) domain-containing protein
MAQRRPVFEAQVLGAMFDHEATIMASVLRTFRSSTSTCLAEIAQAAAAQDMTAIAALAHRLCGASRLTGAQALAEVAGAIELAATRGQIATVRDALPQLDRQWQLLQVAITPWTSA